MIGTPVDSATTTRTVVAGRVQAADGSASSAWVRLLDLAGEFVAEVATSPDGEFRFDVLPGRWVLRALSPLGVTETPVEAEPGRTVEAELRLCELLPERLEIIQISTLSLGNRSYLITDGTVAVAVDPQRDVERIADVLGSRGLRLGLVVETHLHNDYVTGGLELSRRFRTGYAVPTGPRLGFDAVRVADGDLLDAGELRIRVIATPGHTDHHVAYAFASADGVPRLVCTGGSLLYGTTGRTDLMGSERTGPLVHQQYRSVRRLAELLPDDTVVLPTHGFGSFCAATTTSAVQRSTIGRERQVNPVFDQAEDAFATTTLAALEPCPAYYHRMGAINAAGPAPRASLAPPRPAEPAELADRIAAGEWVVDVRARADYASAHLPGTVNFDASGSLATYLGWLVPFDSSLSLLATGRNQLEAVRIELLRIGFDRIAAAAVGSPLEWAGAQWLASYPRADFATLARVRTARPVEVLDVRGGREWRSGHLPGARHIPLPQLPHALASLPDAEYWVHCHSGFRAAIAASLLAAAGHRVVLVDDSVEYAVIEALER